MEQEQRLPVGTWLFLNRLPSDLTPTDLRTFFFELGLDIPLECINVRNFGPPVGGSNAKVSIPANVTVHLLNWAINGAQLQGHDVVAVIENRKARRERARWGEE